MEMIKDRPKEIPRIDMTADDPLSTVNRSAMARELGISISQASRLVAGKRRLTLPMAYTISSYLGITLDDLHCLLQQLN